MVWLRHVSFDPTRKKGLCHQYGGYAILNFQRDYLIDFSLYKILIGVTDVVGLVCPFMQDHYVTLVDENQNEVNKWCNESASATINYLYCAIKFMAMGCCSVQQLNIYLGRAIEERFKEEQLSVWSVVSLKGLRLKGRDATSSVSSAIRIETCDDSVLQVFIIECNLLYVIIQFACFCHIFRWILTAPKRTASKIGCRTIRVTATTIHVMIVLPE